MPFQIKGTRFEAVNLSTAVNFEIAIDRCMLAILKERLSPEELAAIRVQAAEEAARGFDVERIEATATRPPTTYDPLSREYENEIIE